MHAVNGCHGKTAILLSISAVHDGELGYPAKELIGQLEAPLRSGFGSPKPCGDAPEPISSASAHED